MTQSIFHKRYLLSGFLILTATAFIFCPQGVMAQSSSELSIQNGSSGDPIDPDDLPPPAEELNAPIPDGPEVFFDSGLSAGPSVTQSTAPRLVDPRDEPGQKYVIVNKNSSAGSYEAQVVAGNRALKLGRYASALDIFEGLHKKNSRDVRVLMGLAVAQQQSGFTASAIQTYEDVLDRDPRNQEALVNMLGLMKDRQPEIAMRRLIEMRKSNPNHPGIAAQIGLIQADLGRYDEALKYLGVASSMEPRNASHYFNMAIIADRKGKVNTAIELYEEALKVDAMYGASRSVPRDTIYDRLSTLRRS